jgi:hypothetical protein
VILVAHGYRTIGGSGGGRACGGPPENR